MFLPIESLKVSLLNIGYAKLDSSWNYDNVISPFTRLYLITKGEAYVYHNNKEYILRPGNLYLIPSYTYSSYKCNLHHEQFYISFFEEMENGLSIYNLIHFLNEVKASKLDIKCFKRLLKINPERSLVKSNPESYDNYPALYSFQKRNELLSTDKFIETQAIIKLLLSKFIDYKFTSKKKNEHNLTRVLNYISQHLHETITLDVLAAYCHLSKDYFSRSFKKQYGLGPNQYIQLKRIERAQLLLLTTDDSLREISNKVGFYNFSYFSKLFKKIIGQTPAHFRNQGLRKYQSK